MGECLKLYESDTEGAQYREEQELAEDYGIYEHTYDQPYESYTLKEPQVKHLRDSTDRSEDCHGHTEQIGTSVSERTVDHVFITVDSLPCLPRQQRVHQDR